jgi:nitroreductase
METSEAIHGRRSIRDYLTDSVAQSLIEAIIDDAAQAPWTPISAPEPWVFTVIRGAARIKAYGDRALQFARDNCPDRGYDWTKNPDFSVFYNAPTVIIISGKTVIRSPWKNAQEPVKFLQFQLSQTAWEPAGWVRRCCGLAIRASAPNSKFPKGSLRWPYLRLAIRQ